MPHSQACATECIQTLARISRTHRYAGTTRKRRQHGVWPVLGLVQHPVSTCPGMLLLAKPLEVDRMSGRHGRAGVETRRPQQIQTGQPAIRIPLGIGLPGKWCVMKGRRRIGRQAKQIKSITQRWQKSRRCCRKQLAQGSERNGAGDQLGGKQMALRSVGQLVKCRDLHIGGRYFCKLFGQSAIEHQETPLLMRTTSRVLEQHGCLAAASQGRQEQAWMGRGKERLLLLGKYRPGGGRNSRATGRWRGQTRQSGQGRRQARYILRLPP